MINVFWTSYHIARPSLLFGDQVMIKDIFDARPKEFAQHDKFMHGKYKDNGAIVCLPLHHNEKYIDNLNADISKLDWVLIILTANEFGSDAYREIKHPNKRIWLQTPKYEDEADRFLPIGYPTQVVKKQNEKKYDWFFSGQVNTENREQCVSVLDKLPNGKMLKTPGFNQGYPHGEYIKYMGESKVIPCPSGPATPDTFRLYEALELGCIPVVDSLWYWQKVFGFVPIPYVNNWGELAIGMSRLVGEFDEYSTDINRWWRGYKKTLVDGLFNDIKELRSKV